MLYETASGEYRLGDLDHDATELTVSDGLFGANFLFHKDRLESGTYDEAIQALGTQAVRYPGGSVSEWYFDLTDPDRDQVYDDRSDTTVALTPLSDFLSWADKEKLGVSIVIPTSGLVVETADGMVVKSTAYETVKTFVTEVLRGDYGSADIRSFEIGNEYWLEGGLDHVEYTAIADVVAVAAQEAMDELTSAGLLEEDLHPDLVVQIGQKGQSAPEEGYIQNDYIRDNLSDEAAEAIDAVNAHYYARRTFEDLSTQDYYFDRMQDWDRGRFEGIDFYATEWSVENWDTPETGLMQASMLLGMFTQMIEHGVDAAFIWPVQQNTANDLAGREGELGLTSSGELVRLINGALPGKVLSDRASLDDLHVFDFEAAGTSERATFIASRSESSEEVSVDLPVGASDLVFVSTIGTTGAVDDPQATATTRHEISFDISDVEVVLDPFEISLIRTVESGLSGARVGQLAASYTTYTLALGFEQDDVIDGSAGNDLIFGLAGDDTISAGMGDDVIVLEGGSVHRQMIYGGAGSDEFVLTPGAEARLRDFSSGEDVIDVSAWGGASPDDLGFYVKKPGQLFVSFNAERLRIDTERSELDASDFIFALPGETVPPTDPEEDQPFSGTSGDDDIQGGAESDDIVGRAGDDTISGGSGNDTLHGHHGDDLLEGGEGDDVLFGNSGHDVLIGGSGSDVLVGASGVDRLVGMSGMDRFVFKDGHANDWDLLEGTPEERNAQLDVIEDFVIGEDVIDFSEDDSVKSLADIDIWKTFMPSGEFFTIRIKDENERLLVDNTEGYMWHEMHDEMNFLF